MARKKKKRRNNIVVPVASMGDIAFLLIIFFMICSNFAKENYQLKLPAAPSLAKLKESQISVGIDKDGGIYLGGVRVPDAQAIEYGVSAQLQERLKRLPEGQDDTTARMVLFKCDRTISREIYAPVISAISRGGGIVAAIGQNQASN